MLTRCARIRAVPNNRFDRRQWSNGLTSEPRCAQVLGMNLQHLEQMLREVGLIAQSKMSSPLVQAILRVRARTTVRVCRAIRVNRTVGEFQVSRLSSEAATGKAA